MNLSQYITNFKKYSTHTTKTHDIQIFLDTINENLVFQLMNRYFYDTIWSLRNYYIKKWLKTFHKIINQLLLIRNDQYYSLIQDIISLTLHDCKQIQHHYLQDYVYYNLEIQVLLQLGPTIISTLLEQNKLDQILHLIENAQLSINPNIMVFNDYVVYLALNTQLLQQVFDKSLCLSLFKLSGTCILINNLSGKKMQKQSSDNGFLCDEILFYQDYQEAVKYWEGKYEFQPLRAPGVIFEQEIIFPIFDLDLSQLSAYIAAILEQFNIFLEILIQDLQDLVVIDYDNVKNTIIQYANLLKNENLVKLYPPLSQLLVLLISEIYQLNELEVSARKKEKKYENIILIQSQYQYLMKSNQLSFQLPDLTYIQIFQSEIQYQENLKNSMRILQGKQQQNSQIYEDTEMKGTSHVFSQSSNPHQIFKIPACKNKLIILSALAKLIMLNKNGDEMLDEMDLSVGMVRFIVASIFQNENYNNTLRNKVSHKLEFQNNNLDVSYVIYPAAVQSNIFHQLNNSLNISSCYPLSLLDLKTSIQPLPRIKKLSTFVKNLQRIQNNSGYEFIGLYEHSSLTLHQFCIPFDFKDYPLRNLLSLLKSSSCIIVYIFQPSISLLLYSIISQTPKKQLGLNILKLISNEISKNPLLCKQEVILLLLRSFCIIGQTMLQRNLKIDEIVLDFINIFISIIPITELAILIMDVSSEYQEDTVPETLEKRFTDCNNIIDIQYGNKYAVHPQQLNRLNYIVDFLLFCRDSYLQNLEIQDTITSNHVTTLTNQLIIFRFADKGYITKLLQTANIIISKIDIKSIFRKQDMLQLLLQRKQQLISFLIQVQDFAEATGFTDPRIMVLDINMLFFIELRNDYYSERIHRTGNKLMHCFQDQVLKLQSLVEQSIQNSKLEFFAPLLADRLSVAMVLCGTPQSQFSQQYFSVSSLCLDD